jgi:hypothetical protein
MHVSGQATLQVSLGKFRAHKAHKGNPNLEVANLGTSQFGTMRPQTDARRIVTCTSRYSAFTLLHSPDGKPPSFKNSVARAT